MRQIKFRGKKTDSKTWVYGFYFFSEDYGTHFIKDSRKFENSNEYVDYDVEVEGDTVGQFTGYMDKNGVEIYEGDIFTNDPWGWGWYVGFENGGFRMIPLDSVQRINHQHYMLEQNIIDFCEWKLTGNIYDNPIIK